MQLNRVFEIVYILLNKKQVTAKELAERFEVSTRTIYRDIESLCEAGVPIYTNKGKGGGISLMENFVLNKSYLSVNEQQEILMALQGLKATPYISKNEVLGKLSAFFGNEETEWISVDFGSWDTLEKEKFEQIKGAILEKRRIQFDYYNAKMEKANRIVEPIQLCFREKTWYLRGYCTLRKQIRLFKLRRIKHLTCLNELFEKGKQHQIDKEVDMIRQERLEKIRLSIEPSQAYRVYDEFEETQITILPDGHFIAEIYYPEDEWLYGYLLSFGPYAKVLEPKRIKQEIGQRLKEATEQYKGE